MLRAIKRTAIFAAAVLAAAVLVGLPPGSAGAAPLPVCVTDSVPPVPPVSNTIWAAPCAQTFASVNTTRGGKTVIIQYMVHEPVGPPKALVLLFAGGNGDAGITLGAMPTANRNFLVRSAQLFAEHGYRSVTMDRPLLSVGPPKVPEYGDAVAFDFYRISTDHAVDIMAVLAAVNPGNSLTVFFAGTSRGAISAVAQHALSAGISLSSPMTSSGGAGLYVGRPGYPNLQPESVTVPVAILSHKDDGCFASTPDNAKELDKRFSKAGVDSKYHAMNGGFDVTGSLVNGVPVDACDPFTHHGFLGVEIEAVDRITKEFDKIRKGLP